MKIFKFEDFLFERKHLFETSSQNTLENILMNKGNLDHLKTNDTIRLKLIDGEFLRKNPSWKDKPLKFLHYDNRDKLVLIELIGHGIYGNAFPKELIIDLDATNAY